MLNGQFRATEEVYNYMIDRYSQKIGDIVPNCQLMDTKGKMYHLHDFKHKLVILDFWGTWCGSCIKDMPITHGIYDRLKSNGYTDIEWISISTDSDTTKWINMVLSKDMQGYSLLSNLKTAKENFKINGYPLYIFLDEDMRIIGFDISRPNENGGLMEYLICDAYNGVSAGDSFKSGFEKRDDSYYYPSQKFKEWDKKYINVYDIKE